MKKKRSLEQQIDDKQSLKQKPFFFFIYDKEKARSLPWILSNEKNWVCLPQA